MKKRVEADLTKKMQLYDLKGQRKERTIFRAEIPQCMETDRNVSYGKIFLYDDMTERDILSEFRRYKKERVVFLRSCGIKIRKYMTAKSLRDHEWFKLAQSFGARPDYKVLAKEYAEQNKKQVTKMFLTYLWHHPKECNSVKLEQDIQGSKSRGEIFDTFLKRRLEKKKDGELSDDINHYISFQLPRLIRSAVHRYTKSL